MGELDGWTRKEFTADGISHATYRRGAGPGVIVIHEIPSLSPECIAFGQELVDAGFTVVMPHLFGTAGGPASLGAVATVLPGSASARSSRRSRPVRPVPSRDGCGHWPVNCTPNSAVSASGRSACVSPAASRWR